MGCAPPVLYPVDASVSAPQFVPLIIPNPGDAPAQAYQRHERGIENRAYFNGS